MSFNKTILFIYGYKSAILKVVRKDSSELFIKFYQYLSNIIIIHTHN